VSVDEHKSGYQRALKKGRYHALDVAWDPSIQARLGITGLPTTWIVAPDGSVVYQQLGYSETFVSDLEGIVRKYAP
jgi:hypothetical protein